MSAPRVPQAYARLLRRSPLAPHFSHAARRVPHEFPITPRAARPTFRKTSAAHFPSYPLPSPFAVRGDLLTFAIFFPRAPFLARAHLSYLRTASREILSRFSSRIGGSVEAVFACRFQKAARVKQRAPHWGGCDGAEARRKRNDANRQMQEHLRKGAAMRCRLVRLPYLGVRPKEEGELNPHD